MATLAETGEHGFIRAIRKKFPMELAGDDGAVLRCLETPVITTDSFFEGTHFRRGWAAPDTTARRLMEATLSDLAAMGAFPEYLLSSLVLPPDMELDWILDFYRGLTSRQDCPLAGGETVKGGVFGVTLTALGDCRGEKPLLRRTPGPGTPSGSPVHWEGHSARRNSWIRVISVRRRGTGSSVPEPRGKVRLHSRDPRCRGKVGHRHFRRTVLRVRSPVPGERRVPGHRSGKRSPG